MKRVHELSELAKFFDSIYQRTPRGIARVCVAAASGALFATIVVLGHNGPIASQYWYLFAGFGLAIGLVGGTVLGVLERREAAGQAPPLLWIIFRRVAVMFLYLLLGCLLLVLFYAMMRMVREHTFTGFRYGCLIKGAKDLGRKRASALQRPGSSASFDYTTAIQKGT